MVTILVSHRDQRLGDMAAGTLVVRERSARTLVAPAMFNPPPGYERYAASLDVAALDAESYEVVRSFLLRSHEFSPEARDHMAVRLANAVARMNHVPAQFLHPRAFLDCVAAAWQRAHGLVTTPWEAQAPRLRHRAYRRAGLPAPADGPPPGYGPPQPARPRGIPAAGVPRPPAAPAPAAPPAAATPAAASTPGRSRTRRPHPQPPGPPPPPPTASAGTPAGATPTPRRAHQPDPTRAA